MTGPTLERATPGLALLVTLLLMVCAAGGEPLEAAAQEGEPTAVRRPLRLLPQQPPGQLMPEGFDLPAPADDGQDARARSLGFTEPDGVDRLKPDTHVADFVRRHGGLARASTEACTSCHAEQECLDCHKTTLRPVELHPPGYLAYHPLEARREADRCTTCHATQAFCRDCHNAVRAGGTGGTKPPGGLRFHPASWLGQADGPDHAAEARRGLAACTSCHTEQECVRCHVNINPHPPGFVARCRALATRNPSTCGTCHTDLRRVLEACR